MTTVLPQEAEAERATKAARFIQNGSEAGLSEASLSEAGLSEAGLSGAGLSEVVGERGSYAVRAFSDIIDRSLHATAARFTLGLSPATLAHAYLDWVHSATIGIRGVSRQHERMAAFNARQILDVFSPSNFLLTNPEILKRTLSKGGTNLLSGFQNPMEDRVRTVNGRKPIGAANFQVDRDVAITPGKMIYWNRLIELIHYAPATDKVHPEPVLIVPAWIGKCYILDRSPQNLFLKYLTDEGLAVFMISWKNPGREDRDLGLNAYRTLGVMDAPDAIRAVVPDQNMHSVGYCPGGTLLSIAAAAAGYESLCDAPGTYVYQG